MQTEMWRIYGCKSDYLAAPETEVEDLTFLVLARRIKDGEEDEQVKAREKEYLERLEAKEREAQADANRRRLFGR